MQSVLPQKTEDTIKTKETEERRGKCEETMMFENKKDKALTCVLQNNNSTIYKKIQMRTMK